MSFHLFFIAVLPEKALSDSYLPGTEAIQVNPRRQLYVSTVVEMHVSIAETPRGVQTNQINSSSTEAVLDVVRKLERRLVGKVSGS